MSDVPNPHDAFAKEFLAKPEAAVEVLRLTLKPEVLALLDLEHLERVQESWVDEDLKQYFSDVLYRVRLREEGAGQSMRHGRGSKSRRRENAAIHLYILIEHKSSPDWLVGLQLLKYMVRHWLQHLKEHATPLPVVIPLVLYHGEQPWTGSPHFPTLFGQVSSLLKKYIPHFEYELLNLPELDRQELGGPVPVKVALELLRAIFRSDLGTILPQIMAEVNNLSPNDPRTVECLQLIVQYALVKLDETAVSNALVTAFPDPSPPMLSIFKVHYDKGIEEGREQGLEQGIEQGIEQGLVEGLAHGRRLLSRLIQRRFGEVAKLEFEESLAELSAEALDQLGDDLLDLDSVAELRDWFKKQ